LADSGTKTLDWGNMALPGQIRTDGRFTMSHFTSAATQRWGTQNVNTSACCRGDSSHDIPLTDAEGELPSVREAPGPLAQSVPESCERGDRFHTEETVSAVKETICPPAARPQSRRVKDVRSEGETSLLPLGRSSGRQDEEEESRPGAWARKS